jgi:ankyrin repeat protein
MSEIGMSTPALHGAIRVGDTDRIRRLIADGADLEARDASGYTPLMRAVTMRPVVIELLDALLMSGASVGAVAQSSYGSARTVLSLALQTGDPTAVAALIRAGADVDYERDDYGALLDAVHGRAIIGDADLLDLLRILLAAQVRLDDITRYGESALRVLSHWGRFDAVALLLEAGADEAQLEWTPLMRATAIGTLDDVRQLLPATDGLEARDRWSRTAWLIAVAGGDLRKAALLREYGADTRACGRGGMTPLQHAVRSASAAMVRHLLDEGVGVDLADEAGGTALMDAVQAGHDELVQLLLDAGAAVDMEQVSTAEYQARMPPGLLEAMRKANANGSATNALVNATDRGVILRLLQAGADPQHLGLEGRRALLGLHGEDDVRLLDVDEKTFRRGQHRRFGKHNPERMDDPFWLAMIRSGAWAWTAGQKFDANTQIDDAPIWCARRHGQSLTILPDGRIVQVAGEHEDFYDEDFCIYNDVFVHAPDGSIAIYGYPEDVFPPTDFHTATLVGEMIWLIGALGYDGTRRAGVTPVYTLDTRTFRIDAVATSGDSPGWTYRHRAILRNSGEIVVEGGYVHTDESQRDAPLAGAYVLELSSGRWRRDGADRA